MKTFFLFQITFASIFPSLQVSYGGNWPEGGTVWAATRGDTENPKISKTAMSQKAKKLVENLRTGNNKHTKQKAIREARHFYEEDLYDRETGRIASGLRELIKDHDDDVKLRATLVMGQFGDESDIPELEKISALGNQGHPDRGKHKPFRSYAEISIRIIKSRASISKLIGGKPTDEKIKMLIQTFYELNSSASNIDAVFVRKQIMRIGKPAVPALIELLDNAMRDANANKDQTYNTHFVLIWAPKILLKLGDNTALPVLERLEQFYTVRFDSFNSQAVRQIIEAFDKGN